MPPSCPLLEFSPSSPLCHHLPHWLQLNREKPKRRLQEHRLHLYYLLTETAVPCKGPLNTTCPSLRCTFVGQVFTSNTIFLREVQTINCSDEEPRSICIDHIHIKRALFASWCSQCGLLAIGAEQGDTTNKSNQCKHHMKSTRDEMRLGVRWEEENFKVLILFLCSTKSKCTLSTFKNHMVINILQNSVY